MVVPQQALYPDSDEQNFAWTAVGEATGWEAIDDPTPVALADGDTTYVSSTGFAVLDVGLTGPSTRQIVAFKHSIECSMKVVGGTEGTVEVMLIEEFPLIVKADAVIGKWTFGVSVAGSYEAQSQSLSASEAALIVDYDNLRLRMTSWVGVGEEIRVTALHLLVPVGIADKAERARGAVLNESVQAGSVSGAAVARGTVFGVRGA